MKKRRKKKKRKRRGLWWLYGEKMVWIWIMSCAVWTCDGVKGVLFAVVSRSMSEPLQL